MKEKRSKALVLMVTVIICLIALIAFAVRCVPVWFFNHERSATDMETSSLTEAAFDDGSADHAAATLPVATLILDEQDLFSFRHSLIAPQTTAAPSATAPQTSAESVPGPELSSEPDNTAESLLPSESGNTSETDSSSPAESSEFSENSDNLPYIGTWKLEYDLAPAQISAVSEHYQLPAYPQTSVLLRLSAALNSDGTLRLIYAQDDADFFKEALSGWYAEAASIYAENGANVVQKAAFASWSAYRKGLYALLTPESINSIRAFWHAEDGRIFITDADGAIQAEIHAVFESQYLNLTDFTVYNEEYRDYVALMQSTLGFIPPYHLTKN